MAVFARVVDEGSFRGAARALNVSPSRVSETVSDLEAYLSVSLLNRSTRKVALTNEGRIFYVRAVEMIRSAEAGLDELNALSIEPAGALSISMPAFMASSELASAVAEFAKAHPLVKLSVNFSDRQQGLIGAGYDVNIRVGWLDDSAMMARKLGEEGRMLVAGTEYAGGRTPPVHPNDLSTWDWVAYAQRSDAMTFTRGDGQTVKVTGRSHVKVDSVDALYAFTVQNLGVTVLPNHLGQRGIDEGRLVQLLPEWQLRPLGFYAVWPDKSRRMSLALLFVRFVAERYR